MKQTGADSQKLMDRLAVSTVDDPLLGVLATTFEMQPDFVETDYLPTLLALGAWDDRSWASRVAIERKLAEMHTATILCAADQYRGRPRSLRIEIVPVPRQNQGALHAKVSVFVHQDSVRLIIASANLTENGYRLNREVAIALSVSLRDFKQVALIRDCLNGMRRLLSDWWTEGAENLVLSATSVLDRSTHNNAGEAEEWFSWGGDDDALWRQFVKRWPVNEHVRKITIVSPFWSASAEGGPIEQIVKSLAARDALATNAELHLLTEASPEPGGSFRPVLPESYRDHDFRRVGVAASAQAIKPTVTREEADGADDSRLRNLHAKVVLFEGASTSLAYAGSANFTRRGWGFLPNARAANIEAGLILRRTGRARESLESLIPPAIGKAVSLNGAAGMKIATPADESPAVPWPAFIRRVTLVPSIEVVGTQDLEVVVDAGAIEGSWAIEIDAADATVARTILMSGSREDLLSIPRVPRRISLSEQHHTRLLIAQYVVVRWWGATETTDFPINVSDAARLDLPLAPGSGKPGESLLLQYYQSRIAFEDLFPPPPGLSDEEAGGTLIDLLDSSVDTSRIQSYQVREFVEALRGITDELRRASRVPSAMRQALVGAVSPIALSDMVIDAVKCGERTATAAAFQLVELLGCLGQARGFDVNERYRTDWEQLIEEAVKRIDRHLSWLRKSTPKELQPGSTFATFEAAVRTLHGLRASGLG